MNVVYPTSKALRQAWPTKAIASFGTFLIVDTILVYRFVPLWEDGSRSGYAPAESMRASEFSNYMAKLPHGWQLRHSEDDLSPVVRVIPATPDLPTVEWRQIFGIWWRTC